MSRKIQHCLFTWEMDMSVEDVHLRPALWIYLHTMPKSLLCQTVPGKEMLYMLINICCSPRSLHEAYCVNSNYM